MRSKDLADLVPWKERRAGYEQKDSLKAIAIVVPSPGQIDGQMGQGADSTEVGEGERAVVGKDWLDDAAGLSEVWHRMALHRTSELCWRGLPGSPRRRPQLYRS